MRLRPTTAADRERLAELIAADPDHRDKSTPGFWCEPEPGVELFTMSDEQGAVLHVRVERVLRVHLQFACNDKRRTAKGLLEGFSWLIGRAQQAGYRQVISETTARPLIGFCKRHFGFRESRNELVLGVAALDTATDKEQEGGG